MSAPVEHPGSSVVGRCAEIAFEHCPPDGDVIWVSGPKEVNDPHPDALDEHALIRCSNGSYVDWARRQYDVGAEVPTVYRDLAALSCDWRVIRDAEGEVIA